MKYLVLSILAFCLYVVLYPVQMVYSLIAAIVKWNFKIFKRTCYATAFGLDQAGNVGFSDMFNDLLIKSRYVYPFGSPDKTISHTIGKNYGNLTAIGKALKWILDTVDYRHTARAAKNPQYKDKYLPKELR